MTIRLHYYITVQVT